LGEHTTPPLLLAHKSLQVEDYLCIQEQEYKVPYRFQLQRVKLFFWKFNFLSQPVTEVLAP
jgi:hypothetical protein